MSERLPYEEQLQQQWHDLPLPDEDKAWADMKRRLDDDDDDRVVVAWWRRGCGLWVLLALVILALGWWLLQPQQWFSNRSGNNTPQATVQNDTINNKPANAGPASTTTNGTTQQPGDSTSLPGNTSTIPADPGSANRENTDSIVTVETSKPSVNTQSETEITVQPGGKTTRRKRGINNNNNQPEERTRNRPPGIKRNNDKPVVSNNNTDKPVVTGDDKPVNSVNKNDRDTLAMPAPNDKKDNTDSSVVKQQQDSQKQPPDSAKQQQSTTAVKKDSTDTNTADKKKREKEKKPFFFSGGIAMQQQIPIGGQSASPYNAVGRSGSWRDYIPSVYLRFNKKDRWFFQGEFRYGAPQYAKKTLYDQVSVLDTVGVRDFTNITSQRVLKTYYHQLPFTFQHYILPGWSLGGGIVWNKFNGLVTEENVNLRHNVTQNDSTLSNKVIFSKVDSSGAFSKTYFQGVFETQYQWRRFSLGARYAFGLQPYIRIALPGALPREEKNSSLQIFLRYQLWKSKER